MITHSAFSPQQIINSFSDIRICQNVSGTPKLFFYEVRLVFLSPSSLHANSPKASPHPATQTEVSITGQATSSIHGSNYMVRVISYKHELNLYSNPKIASFAPNNSNLGGNIFIQRFCSLLSSQGEQADLAYVLDQAQVRGDIDTECTTLCFSLWNSSILSIRE